MNDTIITLENIKIAAKSLDRLTLDNISQLLGVNRHQVTYVLGKNNKKLCDFGPVFKDFMLYKRAGIEKSLVTKIDPLPWHYWLSGLVDGEGCFSITLKPSKYKPGIAIEHVFGIRMHGKEYGLLEDIRNKLALSSIIVTKGINNRLKIASDTSTGEPTVCLQIKSLPILSQTVIPIFNTTNLFTSKAKSFEMWKRSIYLRLYPTLDNYHELVQIYKDINPRLGNLIKKQNRVNFDKQSGWFKFK